MRTTLEQLVGSADHALTTRTASASRLRSGCFLACHEDCGGPCDRGCSLRDRWACGWAHYSGGGLIARPKKPRPCRPSSATGTRLCTSRLPTTGRVLGPVQPGAGVLIELLAAGRGSG